MQINHGVNKLITLYKHNYESNEIELMDKYIIIKVWDFYNIRSVGMGNDCMLIFTF